MKNKLIIFPILLLLLPGLFSCKKFLKAYSQNLSYVQSASDLNGLLIGNGYMGYFSEPYTFNQVTMVFGEGAGDFYYPWIDVVADDAAEFAEGQPNALTDQTPKNLLSGFHHWQPLPFVDATNTPLTDNDWSRFYAGIAGVNAIYFQAQSMRSSGNDLAMLDKVEGESLFLRAAYYFLLVNIYGKPYAPATAATDMGVPLKTTPDVDDTYYSRASVEAVYNQMVSDLQTAIPLLNGVVQPTIYRANQTAAYLLLSRVYLYMQQYQNAINMADSALNSTYSVTDLNNYTSGSSFTYNGSPEVIFSQGGYTNNDVFADDAAYSWITPQASSYQVSSDLLSSYDSTDLRLTAFFKRSGGGTATLPAKLRTPSTTTTVVSSCFLLRISEALLNKAEAQAILGSDADAINTIQQLRAKRYPAASLPAITVSGEALVNFIRDERRRELCFEAQRWFDLRRYAVNSTYPFTKVIQHNSYAYNGSSDYVAGYYQLNVYSQDDAAYMIPIPAYAISFNNGLLVNETRPTRSMIQ